MRRALLIFGFVAGLAGPAARTSRAQSQASAQQPPQAPGTGGQTIDGVAARIEDDVLTESEVQELGAFQRLVEGQSKSRSELIRELADQWIVAGEARSAKYPRPAQTDVDRAYAAFVQQFKSPEEFQARRAAAGLTESAVRRLLEQQIYLAHFLDFRFRPAAQVSDAQVEAYYRQEFSPKLKARGQEIPPLSEVEDTIREVLVQQAISERATKWLDDTRERLRIDIEAHGGGS